MSSDAEYANRAEPVSALPVIQEWRPTKLKLITEYTKRGAIRILKKSEILRILISPFKTLRYIDSEYSDFSLFSSIMLRVVSLVGLIVSISFIIQLNAVAVPFQVLTLLLFSFYFSGIPVIRSVYPLSQCFKNYLSEKRANISYELDVINRDLIEKHSNSR